MKKAFIVTLTLFLALSMATFASADDRFKINGEFRVAALNLDDTDYDSDVEDQREWFYMRLRLDQRVNVMDGVAVRFRYDLQENRWGLDSGLFGRPNDTVSANNELHIDRAFLQINKPKFDFMIGHLAQYWGFATTYGIQELGMALVLKMPVKLTFNYFKLSENGSIMDEPDTADDRDLYSIMAQYQKFGGYFALINDSTPTDNSPWVFGVFGSHNFNALKLNAALDIFGGDVGATDYMGTQLWVNLEYPFTKAFSAGTNLYYAQGADAGEAQLNQIHVRFGGMEKHEKGLMGVTDLFDVLNDGNQPYEIAPESGSVSFDVYGIYQATPSVKIIGQFGYFTPEEDDNTLLDSLFNLNGSVQWTWAKSAYLQFTGFYTSPDFEGGVDDDATVGLASYLQVRF